jgi:F-type H+-transporting ATPase subunit b
MPFDTVALSVTTRALQLAAEDEPSPLMPHLAELIVGLVAFTLLFLFLRAKVFPMFEKVYAERRNAIEGGMERARKAEEEAQAALAQYREQLAEARHEASRLREDARVQGAAIIAEMREQAQAEARRITDGLASRIVGESLEDDARQRRVVDRFLDELEGGSAEGAATVRGGATRATVEDPA